MFHTIEKSKANIRLGVVEKKVNGIVKIFHVVTVFHFTFIKIMENLMCRGALFKTVRELILPLPRSSAV